MSNTTINSPSVIDGVLDAVMRMINAAQPFARITRGALPTGPGLSCELGPSTPLTVYLDKNSYIPLDVTLNGKHEDKRLLMDTMNNLHGLLTRAKSYPENPRWQITDIQNAMFPRVIGREENNMWLAASSLTVKFYWRGD